MENENQRRKAHHDMESQMLQQSQPSTNPSYLHRFSQKLYLSNQCRVRNYGQLKKYIVKGFGFFFGNLWNPKEMLKL